MISRRQWARKRGHVEIAESEERKHQEKKKKRIGCLKKARIHSEIVPEQEDLQVEAKKKIKAKKWIRK
jgi:hypothetical protein